MASWALGTPAVATAAVLGIVLVVAVVPVACSYYAYRTLGDVGDVPV